MPVYRSRYQYGILKRCYATSAVVSCCEVSLSANVKQKSVNLQEVIRRFNADHHHSKMPLAKKRRMDVHVDLTAPCTPSLEISDVWVALPSGLVLNEDDRKRMINGNISAVQTLLKMQFPHMPGLQEPALGQNQSLDMQYGEFVQILHSSGCHRVAVARLGSQEEAIEIYDSLCSCKYSIQP